MRALCELYVRLSSVKGSDLVHLLQQMMQSDGDKWEALKYLRNLKAEVLGFDFRIQYDTKGRPTAIAWMLPHMRINLLR